MSYLFVKPKVDKSYNRIGKLFQDRSYNSHTYANAIVMKKKSAFCHLRDIIYNVISRRSIDIRDLSFTCRETYPCI